MVSRCDSCRAYPTSLAFAAALPARCKIALLHPFAETFMKKIPLLLYLLVLALACAPSALGQYPSVFPPHEQSPASRKAARKQEKAANKYAKKYAKQQRKALRNQAKAQRKALRQARKRSVR